MNQKNMINLKIFCNKTIVNFRPEKNEIYSFYYFNENK